MAGARERGAQHLHVLTRAARAGVSYSMPNIVSITTGCDGPMPSASRPLLAAWTESACCAMASGWRVYVGMTAVPSSMVSVTVLARVSAASPSRAPRDVRDPSRREAELLGPSGVREEIADARAVGGHLADEDAELHAAACASWSVVAGVAARAVARVAPWPDPLSSSAFPGPELSSELGRRRVARPGVVVAGRAVVDERRRARTLTRTPPSSSSALKSMRVVPFTNFTSISAPDPCSTSKTHVGLAFTDTTVSARPCDGS